MCMSGIHYEIEEEFEEDFKVIDGQVWCNEIEKWVTPEEYEQNLEDIEVDPKLICKYSGLLSVYAYQDI